MDAIRQKLVVQEDGILQIRAPELRIGETAEVIVLIKSAKVHFNDGSKKKSWRDYAGCLEGGDPDGSNNEKIDRDLAASYLDKHEPAK